MPAHRSAWCPGASENNGGDAMFGDNGRGESSGGVGEGMVSEARYCGSPHDLCAWVLLSKARAGELALLT